MEQISRVRYSLLHLQELYDKGDKEPLDKVMRAFKGVKELPHTDPRSFFVLAGYHGLPFKGAGWSNAAYWGGYCHHGNILFPTWHRAYLLKLEESLRSIDGCCDVTLPYWDATDDYTPQYGIPRALTDKQWFLDGQWIENPLRSYVLPVTLYDTIPDDVIDYTKPKGYETKRYPLAGVVHKKKDQAATEAHNAQFKDYDECVRLLNDNIKGWLLRPTKNDDDPDKAPYNPIYEDFRNCLKAPNYTVFSNNTSSKQWNLDHEGEVQKVSLESSHNHIHLAVGGFTAPHPDAKKVLGTESNPYRPIEGASGDMGENDTSSFDPIFYFHHCNIDRMFWIWQRLHNSTDTLEIIEEFPGTNTSDEQGATPGLAANTWINLETPLQPFKKTEVDGKSRYFTSLDVVNIEKQLGYTYSTGSLDPGPQANLLVLGASKEQTGKKLMIGNLDRNQVRGSFVLSATIVVDGKEVFLGAHSVLSRWNLKNCKNCQNKTEVKGIFRIPDGTDLARCTKQKAIIEKHGEDPIVVSKHVNLKGAKGDEAHETNKLKVYEGSEPNEFAGLEFKFI